MVRSLKLAIPAALVALSFAAANAAVMPNGSLAQQFQAKRDIVQMSKQIYGPTAVFNSGQKIPASVNRELAEGFKLPAAAPVSPVPAAMAGKLPHTQPDTHWVRVGQHLLELTPNNTIVMGVYDVLP